MKIELFQQLICPVCSGSLYIHPPTEDITPIKTGEIICQNCSRNYPVYQGIIDLRTGVTKKGAWDLTAFESDYQKKAFYKDIYEYADLDKIPRWVEELRYSKVKRRVVKLLKPLQNSLILDLGCGNGYFIFDVLSHYPEKNLCFIGLDIARPNIDRLNQRVQEEHKDNIIGLLGEAENLPFADEMFDFIVSSEVVEHLFNPLLAFKQAYRVLKKGGRFFITTPARPVTDFWNALFRLPVKIGRFLKGQLTPPVAYDRPLDRKRLRNYLTNAGFKILRMEQSAVMPHESYLSHFPRSLLWLMIKTGDWLEKRFKHLVGFAGLHYLVECEK